MLEEGEDALHCRTWLLPCFKYFTFSLMSVKPLSLNLINCFVLVVLFVVSLSVGVGNFRWADVFHRTLSDSTELMLVSRLQRTFAIVLMGRRWRWRG